MTDKRVDVAVPATTANLGPGFDCLGAALAIYLRVRFASAQLTEITGKGRDRSTEDSLILRSFRAAFSSAGEQAPPVSVEIVDDYPSGRGLGASASAIVAGLMGASALGRLDLSSDDLAGLAKQIEGHADNVLPALLGGLVLSLEDRWLRFLPSPKVSPLILVARTSFKTQAARKVLPRSIDKHDAVSNTAAAAALVSILCGNSDSSKLMAATRDRLHEPYRLPLMPESRMLHESLRERSIATVLSGAGPSLLCLVETDELDETKATAESLMPRGWQLLDPAWDVQGAKVLPA